MDSPDRPSETEGPANDGGDDDAVAGAGNDEETAPDAGSDSASPLARVLRSRATTAVGLVVAVTILGLALRVLLLGDRIAHWDEGRVGYWILYYAETGNFAYRRIIHGPFIQHVNRWLFPVIGANDFTMRLPVALISATLPLSALLFRKHLQRAETVALALFLAVNPVILYYSRFMRSDLLVATFMFVALGTLVRFYDTRKWRYLYAAAALMACGFASKENAILYVLTWLGALGLLADQALYRPRAYRSGSHLLAAKVRSLLGTARSTFSVTTAANGGQPADGAGDDDRPAGTLSAGLSARRVAAVFGRYGAHFVGVAVVFLGLSLFFYAPRGAGEAGLRHPPMTTEQVMFWQAIADPTQLPALVEHTWTHVRTEYGQWFSQAGESGDETIVSVFVEFLGRYVRVMGTKAAPLTILAIVGFVYERYGREHSRNLVMFSAYCGFVSVIGYPLGTDIFGAWIVVHALVPLAIPAAVGLGVLFQWGHDAFAADDVVGVAAAGVVLLVLTGQIALVTTGSVYQHPQSDDNYLVQYAQPSDDPRAELNAIRSVAGDDSWSGSDVMLYYGETGDRYSDGTALVEQDQSGWNSSYYSYEPLCSKWFNILPLPWYFASSDASVDCAREPATLEATIESTPPAVVISVEGDQTVPDTVLQEQYTRATYSMRTSGTRMVFWVHDGVEIDRETDGEESVRSLDRSAAATGSPVVALGS